MVLLPNVFPQNPIPYSGGGGKRPYFKKADQQKGSRQKAPGNRPGKSCKMSSSGKLRVLQCP